MRLMTEAAQAGLATSYQGVEIISRWGSESSTTLVMDLWHQSGGQTLTRAAATGTVTAGGSDVSDDTDGQNAEGVLGVTKKLIGLLCVNYDVLYVGPGSAVGRPAQVVEAWRPDGSIAARFWLDKATRLPLRREIFDSRARVTSEDVFVDLTVGAQSATGAPSAVAFRPWADRLTSAQVAGLRMRGWPVPGALPGGLTLFGASETAMRSGAVLDLSYSDGLSVVSLFVQRGSLAGGLTGWQKITLDGRDVYAGDPDERSLTWSARGFVFTLIADASASTVNGVVDALPRDPPPGFWRRLGRGFGRLASLANPFR